MLKVFYLLACFIVKMLLKSFNLIIHNFLRILWALTKQKKRKTLFAKKRDFIFAVENKMNNTLNFEVCLTHYANHTTSVSLAIFL